MKNIIIFIIACMVLQSCSNPIMNTISVNADFVHDTPYASKNELDSLLSKAVDLVDWRVARIFAALELVSSDFSGWDTATLSEYPVIIYSADLLPKYYEFRVISSDREIGSITTVARKQLGYPTRYMMTEPIQYVGTDMRAALGLNKIVDAGYPSRILYSSDTSLYYRSVNPETGKSMEVQDLVQEVDLLTFLNNASEEDLIALGINHEELDYIIEEAKIKAKKISSFWDEVELVKDQILATSMEEILNAGQESRSLQARSGSTTTRIRYATRWYNKRNWEKIGGWCGPSALAFVAIGGDYYPGVDWTPQNNRKTLLAVYYTFEQSTGEGPKLWTTLDSALQDHTGFKLDRSNTSHAPEGIYSHLNARQMPALSLRTWARRNGDWSWEWHYRVIIGIKRTSKTVTRKFLWHTWQETENTYDYLMRDNGADGYAMTDGRSIVWWERSGSSAQFQSVNVRNQ